MAATNKCQRTCLPTNGIGKCECANLNGVGRAGRRTAKVCDATSRGVIPSHGAQQHQPRGHPQPRRASSPAAGRLQPQRNPQTRARQSEASKKDPESVVLGVTEGSNRNRRTARQIPMSIQDRNLQFEEAKLQWNISSTVRPGDPKEERMNMMKEPRKTNTTKTTTL